MLTLRWRWLIYSLVAVLVAFLAGERRLVGVTLLTGFTVGLLVGAVWVALLIRDFRSGQRWAWWFLFPPVMLICMQASDFEWQEYAINLLAALGSFYAAVFVLITIRHPRLERSLHVAIEERD